MHDIYHISGKFDIVKVGQIPTLRILTKCSRGAYIRNVLIFCTHCNGLNSLIEALILKALILNCFSLTIWARFIKFVKLSLRQSFPIYGTHPS